VRVTLQVGSAEQAVPEIETEPLLEYEVVIVGKPALAPGGLRATVLKH
jgi:hypothetical protein